MRNFSLTILFGLVLFPTAACLSAEIPMHALVIGNSSYPEGKLKNPINDAQLMQQTLADLGFQVTTKTNLSHQQMDEAVGEFSRTLPRGSVAFFFFAGHGVQDKSKRNYLIPVDAKLNNESSVKYQAMALDYVMDTLEDSNSNLNIVVLDCCRDNPFERSWGRSIATRGLAGIEAPEGTIIAFSTASGKTAADGDGQNSPYTTQLASALKTGTADGLPLLDVFRQASQAVLEVTRQRPFLEFDASMPKFHLSGTQTTSTKKIASAVKTTPPKAKEVEAMPPLPGESGGTPRTESTDVPLLRQAVSFANNRQHDLAIEAYTAVIMDQALPREVRMKARRGRGGAYLARRSGGDDIKRAIIDYQAAGSPGVNLSVLADQATMKIGTQSNGNVHRNEIVLLTRSNGDWLWVESVQGNESRRGWVTQKIFFDAVKTTAQVADSSPTRNSTASSTHSTTGSPGSRPIGSIPMTGSTNPSIHQDDAHTLLHGPDPHASHHGTNSGTVIVGYDQNGQPIYGQRSRQTQPAQTQTSPTRSIVGYDQYGRPIYSSGNTHHQHVQPQQPTYRPQQPRQYVRPTQPTRSNPPPRPKNAWETPGWESAAKARLMREAQQAWDRKFGN
ncbi:MAG: caspase family protein [Pirellulaceae bacterium]|nr:caspase family protein [Pirellulaceae bacterium]